MGIKFKPGQSGNPSGRPAGARNRLAKRVFEDILQHWTEPSKPEPKLMRGPEAPSRPLPGQARRARARGAFGVAERAAGRVDHRRYVERRA
jgi:hypothetical protein